MGFRLLLPGLLAVVLLVAAQPAAAQAAQKVCSPLILNPVEEASFPEGGTFSIDVQVPESAKPCIWSATSNVDWMAITSSQSASGSGRVQLSAKANPEACLRTGKILFSGGETYTLNQEGVGRVFKVACASPTPAPSGTPSAVNLAPHKLSACFQSSVNTFNAAVKAGKGIEAAGADAQAVVEKMCPDLDFTGLELSPQAVKCKTDFEACVVAAKDSATCKRALLLCIATTPEAKAYKLQTLQMNLKVDRSGLLKRDSSEVATADASGRNIGVLKVKTEDGKLKEAKWESNPIGVDFTEVAPDVGKGEIKVNLGLKDIPESVQLKFNAKRDDEVKKALDTEAAKKNLKLLGVAFSVDVETNMQVNNSTFQVKCNKAWADKHGTGKVKVLRQSGGATEVLETMFKGYEGDLAIFETTSPGLSVFSLAAVEPAAGPPAKSPGFETLFGLAALAGALLLARRRLL